MNPNLCRIALRPRDVFEVLDLSFRLVRERWRPLATLTAIVVLPWLLALGVACWWFEGHWAIAFAPLVLAPLVQAPYTVLVGRMLFSDVVRVHDVLWEVAQRSPWLFGAWFIGLSGWLVSGAITCFVALPLAQMATSYLTEAALLEKVGPQRGLRRSMRLAFGHTGVSLAGVAAWWTFTLWGAITGEMVGQAIVDWAFQVGTPLGSLLDGEVTPYLCAGMLLAQPWHAIYRLLLYVDVRTRIEGWDLQVALRAAGLAK